MILLVLLACSRGTPPAVIVEPLPVDEHLAAEASASERVGDPSRNGPATHPAMAPLPPFLGVDRKTATYVGATVCSTCHPEASSTWSESGHAHARDVLSESSRANDPSCLRCHTTGFGHPGGFGSGGDNNKLGHVGCESCHGPGSDHTALPRAGYGDLPQDFSACVACHTHDNSPGFEWPSYWSSIQH